MISPTVSEILKFAVRMEGVGERFYRDIAFSALDDSVKNLFNHLAGEEAKHKKIFEGLLTKIDTFTYPENYPVEYLEYFYYYLDKNIIFSDEKKDSLPEPSNMTNSFDLSMQLELDSVVLYQELKQFVSAEDNETIENVINEERKHFIMLSELKHKFAL